MLIQQIILGFCAFSLSFTVFAVDKVKPETTRAAPSGGMYLALGKMNIDSTVANKENVKDSASYIRLGVDSMSKHWFFGGGFSGIFYSDKVGFSQTVKDQFGVISNVESSADSVNLYGETGFTYRLADFLIVDLLAGYELVLSSSRSIANCSNCASQDIEIDTGPYLTPRVRLVIKNNYTISISSQQFLTGDVKSVLLLTLGLLF